MYIQGFQQILNGGLQQILNGGRDSLGSSRTHRFPIWTYAT